MLIPVVLPSGRASEFTRPAPSIIVCTRKDRNGFCCLLCGANCQITDSCDDINVGFDQLCDPFRQQIRVERKCVVNDEVFNTRLALGQEIDLSEHAAVCSSMVRIAAKIGLSRRSRLVSGLIEAKAAPPLWSPLRDVVIEELAKRAGLSDDE
jgi:hypothetical protein